MRLPGGTTARHGPHHRSRHRHEHPPHRLRRRRRRRVAGDVGLCRGRRERHRRGRGRRASRRPAPARSTCSRTPCPKVGYDKLIPAFQATEAGKGVQFQQSYGASGDQSRKVEAGAEADFVNFSVEPDITRLVDAGLVDASWNAERAQGHPVRLGRHHRRAQGQPQGHQGLGRPAPARRRGRHAQPVQLGLGEVEPARAVRREEQRRRRQGGRPRLRRRARRRPRQDPAEVGPRGHRGLPPGLRRRAAQLRERGAVHRAQAATRSSTSRRRRPSRSRTRPRCSRKSPNAEKAKAFNDFLYTPEAQRLWAEAGFRPVDTDRRRGVRRRLPRSPRSSGPSPTSAGGRQVDSTLFKKDVGAIAKIYDAATQ